MTDCMLLVGGFAFGWFATSAVRAYLRRRRVRP